MTTLDVILLAVVEGLTEYLPVSSTGHIIIASTLLGIKDDPFVKDFTVIVQFGAILSVLVLYWRRFFRQGFAVYKTLAIAFLPAAVLGYTIKNSIDQILGSVLVVAISLIVGGIVLLFVDRMFSQREGMVTTEKIGLQAALIIGCCQCLAFIPGISRAAATIVGGLWQKMNRQSAAEFSFLLAVPTLAAATGYKSLKVFQTLAPGQLDALLLGNVISFLVGMITIKTFIGFLTRKGFFAFGIYRILVGTVILVMLALGHELII
jgi:undecaprenyl-diphosphatase